MAVYVDPLKPWPQKAKGGRRYFGEGKQSCHLATDGEEDELHAFAAGIGMRREWFQPEPLGHYDLTPKRRAAAVKAGAVELPSPRELVRRCRKR